MIFGRQTFSCVGLFCGRFELGSVLSDARMSKFSGCRRIELGIIWLSIYKLMEASREAVLCIRK
jgi:hypothetical protein